VRSGEGITLRNTTAFQAIFREESSLIRVIIAAAIVFAIALAGMAVGVILGNRRLQGSCGGPPSMPNDFGVPECNRCADPSRECARNVVSESSAKP